MFKKIVLTVSLALIFLSSPSDGLTICKEDYPKVSYNLICPANTVVYVNVVTANFLSSTANFIAPGSVPCNQVPNLILNISAVQIASVCDYCRLRSPCVITNDFIGLYQLFMPTNFNSQTLTPYNIVIDYLCLSKQLVFSFSAY